MSRSALRLERDREWEARADIGAHENGTDVAVADDGHVCFLTRRPALIALFEPDGAAVATWDALHLSTKPHGVTVGEGGRVYVVDEGDYIVKILDRTGELEAIIGEPGHPSDTGIDASLPTNAARLASMAPEGGPPFNRPTKLAVGTNGDLYVSDGYGNCRVHRFSPGGELIASWGRSGIGPGEFHLPHSIAADQQGRVLVADRDNDRVQLFDLDGNYVGALVDLHRPAAVAVGPDGLIYVGELAVAAGRLSFVQGPAADAMPARISVFDADGDLVARREADTFGPAGLTSPHGIAVDADHNVYIAQLPGEGGSGSDATAPSLMRLTRH